MGWLVVRDALYGRAVARRGRALEHAPPHADRPRRRARAAADGQVRAGHGRAAPGLRAGVRLRARGRRVEYAGDAYNEAVATADGVDIELKLTTDLRVGFEGRRARARHDAAGGRAGVRRAVVERSTRRRATSTRPSTAWSAPRTSGAQWLNRGVFPDHPWRVYLQRSALTLKGLTYAPDRGDARRGHDVAARDARRRAQLGLPLLVDPRLHVHALGPLHARLRLGGERLLLLRRRRRRRGGQGPPDHVRHRRREAELEEAELDHLTGYEGAKPVRIGNGAYNQAPARRVGRRARLRLPAHAVARPAARADLADAREAGGGGARELARARPRHLGGARRARSTSRRRS